MKKLNLLLLVSLLMLAGCGTEEKKASMDAETEKELIAEYGNPVIITVAEPGTLKQMFEESETDWGNTRFLRLAGNLNGTDIAALNSQLESSSVNALDMLDVNIVEGGEPYYDFGGDSLYTENNVIGKEFIHWGYVKQLFLPLSAKELQEQALYYCDYLTFVKLPEGLEKIEHDAFPSGVKSITIPRSVIYLDKNGFGKFEDIYMEWTAEELAKFQDVDVLWFLTESEGHRSTFTFKRPTLHVPAGTEAAYEATFKGVGKVVANTGETSKNEEGDDEEDAKAEAEEVLNKSLMGLWVNNDEASVMLELSDTYKTFDAGKGYGYVLAANEYYEYDFKLVFTSISPDGDNIKVKYDEIESYFEGDGDPDNYDDEGGGEWKEKKIGSGELTLQPQGSNMKIISSKKRISNKVLHRN